MSNHVIITGTGRAGTTLLVQILTLLGLDTGFTEKDFNSLIHPISLGGLERDIRDYGKKPYVIKNPWICDYIIDVLNRDDIQLDHVIIPIRNLYEAAESRRQVSEMGIKEGGLWGMELGEFNSQEKILSEKFYHLILALSCRHVPITFINFPKFVEEPSYLFWKIRPIFPDISFQNFAPVFKKLVNKDLIDVE